VGGESQLTDPIPVAKIVASLPGSVAGKHLGEKMQRNNYRIEKRGNKLYCQRADALAMFSKAKHKEIIKNI